MNLEHLSHCAVTYRGAQKLMRTPSGRYSSRYEGRGKGLNTKGQSYILGGDIHEYMLIQINKYTQETEREAIPFLAECQLMA